MMRFADPELLCFQHCAPETRLFCLEVPDVCPVCGQDISPEVDMLTKPFPVPCPFVAASDAKSCLLIRPTKGDFLHNYKSSMDLHIGVTDSQGNVYEFESQGVRITSSESSSDSWNQCLVIPIASQRTAAQTAWTQHWDYTLSITAYMDIWSSDSYQETDLNCYSFVLTFLKMLHVKELKPSLINKTQFCSDFILQRTRLAAKYISLYRQVIREAVSVIPLKSQQSYNTAAADASV